VRKTIGAFGLAGVLALAGCGDDGGSALDQSGDAPTLNDHWHTAYGVYECDHWLPPLSDVGMDEFGIHTHADGIVHIHPFTSAVTGAGANVGVFLQTEGVVVTDDALTFPDGTVLDASSCGDGTQLVVARWSDGAAEADAEIIETDLAKVRLLDRDAITIAALPAGTSPPKPVSVPTLDDLADVVPMTTATIVG
jgi:hypothetical protein